MARSRNIKPGFFLNEELAEIHPLGRLLFAGLWCIADKEGRLEDRPKKIKAEILPYDDCDVDELLQALADKEFILRYNVNGKKYIAIINWHKHQRPHIKETPSEIPGPPTELSENEAPEIPEQEREIPEQAPNQHLTDPPDSLNLDPDSLNLEKDKSIALTGDCPPDGGPDSDVENSENSSAKEGQGKTAEKQTPYQEIVALYNEICVSLPKVREISESRKRTMRIRWKRNSDLERFRLLFTKAEQSDFLTGRSGKWNGCNFDWLLNEKNMVKVLEGTYDNKKQMPKAFASLKDWADEEDEYDAPGSSKTGRFRGG